MISVSLCMIVKNEELLIARCLDSMKGIADEIVIADTGSTDRTKEIALRYTDKVYDFPWTGDFSDARNFVFSQASMDYIYSADADEVLDEENRGKFLLLKENLSADVELVQMKYTNQLQFNTTYNFNTEYRQKLFKRVRTFRWIEPVHEIVDLNIRILNSDISITHMPAGIHTSRDLLILEKAARKGALSSRLHRMYAKELFISGTDQDFYNAFTYFEPILHDEARSLDDVRAAQCIVAHCARIKGDSETLMKAALKNVISQPSAEICCELGDYYLECQDYEEAATWYYTAAFGAQCELDVHCSGDKPLLRLSDCYAMLGNQIESNKYKLLAETWELPKSEDETS